MTTLRHLTLAAAALAASAFAADAFAVGKIGDAVAGKAKATACHACHGDGNKTLDGTYPRLAGQYPDYLAKALREYRDGKRKNAIMAGQAQALKDKDINDLAEYFGSLDGTIHDISGETH
jgi:cytochrome c553